MKKRNTEIFCRNGKIPNNIRKSNIKGERK